MQKVGESGIITVMRKGMELRTFCMVSVYCCTGHRPLFVL